MAEWISATAAGFAIGEQVGPRGVPMVFVLRDELGFHGRADVLLENFSLGTCDPCRDAESSDGGPRLRPPKTT
jgi:hypothetical protein